MSDLRPEDRLTIRKSDGLSEYVVGLVERWENKRDVEYRARWEEYYRMWAGQWSQADVEHKSERSRAIMPAITQAVDSAVSEVEEALFSQERWFDVDSDDPKTAEDEGKPGRMTADLLLDDLETSKKGISETVLNAAIYGTGIGKVLTREVDEQQVAVELIPIDPFEFIIDPGARTIEEAEGVAHMFHIPYHVVLERQRQGIYEKVDPRIAAEPQDNVRPGDPRHVDSDTVHIIEYQGLVPASMIPDAEDGRVKLPFEDEKPVEAIVTIANRQTVLRAQLNTLDRGFVAFQWSTEPNRFYGRGVVQQGYWPQKVLNSEVRARTDALAFNVRPMIAVNGAMVPRGSDFSVRPGRNIFLNGSPSEALQPIQFPPPDPQTYVQGQEMQRMIEMATGQLQAATPFGQNGRNETASGMSMILGASIRRTRRTMANIERSFTRPFINKALLRFREHDARYVPEPFTFKIAGALGMMAREFESMQLTQLLNALPPGPASFAILRGVVDNSGLRDKQNVLELLDLLTAESLEPEQPQPDLGGEARVMSAQTREKEVEINSQVEQARLQLEQAKIQLQAQEAARVHEREIMRLSIEAERVDSEDVGRTSKAMLDLAKAEAEESGRQLEQLRAQTAAIDASQPKATESASLSGEVISMEDFRALREEIEALKESREAGGLSNEDIEPLRIERDAEGIVTSIGGRRVQRNDSGLIEVIQ